MPAIAPFASTTIVVRVSPLYFFPFHFPYDLLCDTSTEASQALGVFGEQEWKGKKYDGLTRTTIVVDAKGAIAGILQGIKPEEHAAQALKLLGG